MTGHQKLLMHYPYIVPVNYGFEWKDTLIFYLHTAPDGHKNQLRRKNNKVALNNHRPPLIRVAPAWKEKIVLIKVTVDQITGKAQYPLDTMEDVEIPPNCLK